MYLYKNNKGIAGKLNQINAEGAEVALAFNDIIISLGKGGNVKRYANGAWTTVHANGDLANLEGNGIFVDSRGYIYIGFEGNTIDLFRSTDNGLTFVSVVTPKTDDNLRSICEDDQGNLYVGSYTGLPAARVPSLFKYTASLDTWTDIYSNLAHTYNRHMHVLYWCPFRKVLIIGGGDNGSTAYPQYSSDNGATWTTWSEIGQITGISSDESYIYFCADTALDRDIYRATELGGAVTSVFSPESILHGFCWELYKDELGRIIAPYSQTAPGTPARMYVSEKQGSSGTWELVNETNGDSVLNRFAYYRATCSDYYAPGIQQRFHCSGDSQGTVYGWRIMAGDQDILVDEANGSPLGDGVLLAKNEVFDYEPLLEHSAVRLDADYSTPVRLEELKRINGQLKYGFTGTQAAGAQSSTDFEGGSGGFTDPNLTGINVDLASTVNPNGGTTHLRADTTTGSGLEHVACIENQYFASTSQGDELWLKGDVFLNTAATSELSIFGIRQGGIDFFVSIYNDLPPNTGVFVHFFNTPDGSRDYVQDPNKPQISITNDSQYHTIKTRVKAHDTDGRVTVWVDGVVAIDAIGIRTTNTANSKQYNDPWFGARTAQAGIIVDWDNITVSINQDPDLATNDTAVLAGSNQKARSIKQVSKVLEIAGTDNAMECCVCDSPSVVPYKLSGIRSECHNGAFFGGTAAIENNSAAGAVYNSIFSGQSSQSITETQVCNTAGNTYDGTLVATPDATDVVGAHGLTDPANGNYYPLLPVKGVFKRLIYDSKTIKFSSPPNIGTYEYRVRLNSTSRINSYSRNNP